MLGPVLCFGSTGPQTIRIQTREDGLAIDQIGHLARKPRQAPRKNDTTILPAS